MVGCVLLCVLCVGTLRSLRYNTHLVRSFSIQHRTCPISYFVLKKTKLLLTSNYATCFLLRYCSILIGSVPTTSIAALTSSLLMRSISSFESSAPSFIATTGLEASVCVFLFFNILIIGLNNSAVNPILPALLINNKNAAILSKYDEYHSAVYNIGKYISNNQ